MNQIRRMGVLGITLLTLTSGLAQAENEPKQIGAFEDWVAYAYDSAESRVCYVSSSPKSTEPKGVKRDPAFFLVTNMPGRKPPVKGEVSTINFEMFSKGDTAWVDTGTDKKIVAAMKAGKSLKVKGTSWRGKTTEDSYSLQGISAALAAIDKACK